MHRFYISTPLSDVQIRITAADFVHQTTKVLRFQPHDSIVLFNGDGYEYVYAFSCFWKDFAELDFVSKTKNTADSNQKIIVYQALPNKWEKLEFIVQKWVEVGISEFVFFKSERSQPLPITDRKMDRLQIIAKEALEQCGGNQFPKICVANGFPPILPNSVFLHTQNQKSLSVADFCKYCVPNPLHFFVWPEGGWSDREVEWFFSFGAKNVSIGKRVLRTETASTVFTAIILNIHTQQNGAEMTP